MTDLPPSYTDPGGSGYTNWATQLPAGPAPSQQQSTAINDVPNTPPPTYSSGHDDTPRLALNSLPARRSTLTTGVMRTAPSRTTNVVRNIQVTFAIIVPKLGFWPIPQIFTRACPILAN